MIKALDKFIEISFKVLKVLLVVVIVVMVAILVAHIFFRYVINNSLTWSEELLKILLVWFGMLSVSILAVRREHVSIVVFKEHMPKPVADLLTKIAQLLTVIVCVIVTYVGVLYVISAGYRPTPALQMPYGYAYAAVPVSFFFVTIFEFRNLLVDLTGKGSYAAIEKPEEDLTGGRELKLE